MSDKPECIHCKISEIYVQIVKDQMDTIRKQRKIIQEQSQTKLNFGSGPN